MRDALILITLHDGDIRYIDAKLKNIAKQDLSNSHIIFLNNLDYDEINVKVKRFMASHRKFSTGYILFTKNTTLYETWNYAIEEHGDDFKYIVNSNPDDLWHKDYLAKCIETLNNDDGINIATSKYYITDRPNQEEPWENIIGDITPLYPHGTLGPSPMARRGLFEAFGPYRTDLTVAGDAELWERWRKLGVCTYKVIDQHMILYLTRGDSLERRRNEKGELYTDVDSILINGPPKGTVTRIKRNK